MGTHREDGGYSASVDGFLVIEGQRIRLAKTNGYSFVLAEPCELAPDTEGDMQIIVDGAADSTRIALPQGTRAGQTVVEYKVVAPV